MSRKNTVWGARHFLEKKELDRIIVYYRKFLNLEISILEASAILAIKSKETIWNRIEAKEMISKLRGL